MKKRSIIIILNISLIRIVNYNTAFEALPEYQKRRTEQAPLPIVSMPFPPKIRERKTLENERKLNSHKFKDRLKYKISK